MATTKAAPVTAPEGAPDQSDSDKDLTAPVASANSPPPGSLRELGALQFSATLGQIVVQLMRMPHHRHTFLADLEWLVLPAIATNQFAIHAAPGTANNLNGPAAAVLFASVSAEVDQRLTANPAPRVRLKPEEWASGPIPWLVDVAGDPRTANAIVMGLLEQRFKATGLKTYARGPDGKSGISVLRAGDKKAVQPTDGAV